MAGPPSFPRGRGKRHPRAGSLPVPQASSPASSGSGHDATSRRLEWQVVGVDPGFDHDTALIPGGQTLTGFAPNQTVNLRPRVGNPAGHTEGAVKTVTVV